MCTRIQDDQVNTRAYVSNSMFPHECFSCCTGRKLAFKCYYIYRLFFFLLLLLLLILLLPSSLILIWWCIHTFQQKKNKKGFIILYSLSNQAHRKSIDSICLGNCGENKKLKRGFNHLQRVSSQLHIKTCSRLDLLQVFLSPHYLYPFKLWKHYQQKISLYAVRNWYGYYFNIWSAAPSYQH